MLVRKTLSREPVHHPLRYFNLSTHFHFNFVSFRTSVLYGSFSPCSTKPSAGSHVASHCHILNLLYSGTVPQPFFASMTLANFCVCVCVCVCFGGTGELSSDLCACWVSALPLEP
jgi:hypothetical protein